MMLREGRVTPLAKLGRGRYGNRAGDSQSKLCVIFICVIHNICVCVDVFSQYVHLKMARPIVSNNFCRNHFNGFYFITYCRCITIIL